MQIPSPADSDNQRQLKSERTDEQGAASTGQHYCAGV